MIRNILAVVVGLIVANIVNMGLITLGHSIVELPPGSDISTMEGLRVAMQSFGPEQFIFPFLAHAIGTLAGAFVAALIAASHKFKIAMAIGVVSLLGGIAAGIYLQAPLWFSAIDFVFAYIPMAWIGAKLGGARGSR
jgi:uncharacterized membrane protein YjjP (DUF1212 family)